jgi:pimeloyl-ACP methyl ester carboxylesterase
MAHRTTIAPPNSLSFSAVWKGAKITQPSFTSGKADGLAALYPPAEKLHAGLAGLVGHLELDDVGHWIQHEAAAEVSEQLVNILRS